VEHAPLLAGVKAEALRVTIASLDPGSSLARARNHDDRPTLVVDWSKKFLATP
jgi:hypothetical protein